MRGTVAKRLRAQARAEGKGRPRYQELKKQYKRKGK